MARKKVKDISELAKVVIETTDSCAGISPVASPVADTISTPTSITPPSNSALSPQTAEEVPVGVDKVNDVNQKELALYRVGVTRRKVYDVIRELLEATKVNTGYDEKGRPVSELVPDLDKRARGAEVAMKAFGDMKEVVAVNTQVNNVLDISSILKRARERKKGTA